jgi:catechol 2,3-dioxygenase-like lactoylglutathione lyase family enzyme
VSQRYVAAAFVNGRARRPAPSRPPTLPVGRVRVTRPTDRLEELRGFYGEGLGLHELGRFGPRDGYSGVLFGLLGETLLLEFVHHEDGSPAPPPRPDNLLVLYLEAASALRTVAERLASRGHAAVGPVAADSLTVADPDGWPVVLALGRTPAGVLAHTPDTNPRG